MSPRKQVLNDLCQNDAPKMCEPLDRGTLDPLLSTLRRTSDYDALH